MNDIIKIWNEQAEEFKNSKLRKMMFNIERKIERVLIVRGVEYTYFLYMYMNKMTKKRFVYYHNETLRKTNRKKYFYEDIECSINDESYERNYKELKGQKTFKIPYHIYAYWKNKKTAKTNYFYCENSYKNNDYETIQLDIDDAYIYVQENKEKQKIRCRMVTIHTGYKLPNKKINHKTILIQFTNCNKPKNNKLLDEKLKHTVEYVLENIYHKSSLIVSGDGARSITKFAEIIQAERAYDKFHFMRILYDVFGYSQTRNVSNRRLFSKYRNVFQCLKTHYYNGNFKEFLNEIKQTIEWLKTQKGQVFKINEIKRLLKFINKNKEYLANTICLKNYFGGNAETFVSHNLKRFTDKKFSLFSHETIKNRIFNNLKKENNVIFI